MKMVQIVLLYIVCLWHLVGVFSDTAEVKSVMEGDSVTLNSGVTEVQKDDDIEWRFNSILIAKANIPQYGNEERFRDRLKLDRTGSLTITNTRTTDSGLYKLTVIVGYNEIINTFNVTVDANPSTSAPTITPQHPSLSESENVKESDQQTPSPPPVSVSLIVPISSAVAGSLMIVAAVGIFWICKKHRKTDQQVQTRDEEITYADPMFYKRNAQKANSEMTEVVYTCLITVYLCEFLNK
ncbi:hypothetical protein PO909_027948 [Leuciscus waleckii]